MPAVRPALRRRILAVALAAAGGAALTAAAVGSSAGADPAYSVQSLHFAVHVGPGGTTNCDIVGDLYLPTGASSTNRVPSILTTNGFGGSASDQAPFAEKEAALGYAVLSYSGLGFGGSGCKITLDDPDWDGAAASQLVSYLGGAPGIAYVDAAHTTAAPTLDAVVHDTRTGQTYDPRVGMWGGSYGGQVQFAAAAVDPRIDAINPQITWNDLSYSLAPNNTGQVRGVTPADPGVAKSTWAAAFSGIGIFDGVEYAQNDPSRLIGCPNFATFVCPSLAVAGSTGFLPADSIAALQHASVATYLSKIKIPVLLDQGQVDTLFNLNEAIATYQALRAQGTTVDMLWREQGHSGGTPSAAGLAYENSRIQAWFDHYLKDTGAKTGSKFAYYQDWTGTFAEASGYPVGTLSSLYLSGGQSLVSSPTQVTAGTQAFVTPPAGAPSSLGGLDAVGGQVPVPLDVPDVNLPGTFASWSTTPLSAAETVVGSPTLTVSLNAPTAAVTSAAGPAGQLVLFAKLYDVAPNGTASLIHGLVAPVRIADPTNPVQITLPAVAHQFPAGDRIEIVLASGDPNYRGGLASAPVTVAAGRTQVFRLPVVNAG